MCSAKIIHNISIYVVQVFPNSTAAEIIVRFTTTSTLGIPTETWQWSLPTGLILCYASSVNLSWGDQLQRRQDTRTTDTKLSNRNGDMRHSNARTHRCQELTMLNTPHSSIHRILLSRVTVIPSMDSASSNSKKILHNGSAILSLRSEMSVNGSQTERVRSKLNSSISQ